MKFFYRVRILLILGIIVSTGFVFSETLLTGVFRVLMHEDDIVQSDVLVVLTGSHSGNRIEAAVKLYHEGLGKKLVFSGFAVYPGTYTSTLMKTYALKLGVPENNIITEVSNEEASTRGESITNLELLKKNQIKNFVLVTSAFHTRRAKLIYERTISLLGHDIEFLVHPAPDPSVPLNGWWKLRTGQKTVLSEYAKSIAYYFKL